MLDYFRMKLKDHVFQTLKCITNILSSILAVSRAAKAIITEDQPLMISSTAKNMPITRGPIMAIG